MHDCVRLHQYLSVTKPEGMSTDDFKGIMRPKLYSWDSLHVAMASIPDLRIFQFASALDV